MPTIMLSRRSYLLSRPSERLMRAAGHASSSAAREAIARKQAEKQFADLIYHVTPRMYEQAQAEGLDMRMFAKSQPLPVS